MKTRVRVQTKSAARAYQLAKQELLRLRSIFTTLHPRTSVNPRIGTNLAEVNSQIRRLRERIQYSNKNKQQQMESPSDHRATSETASETTEVTETDQDTTPQIISCVDSDNESTEPHTPGQSKAKGRRMPKQSRPCKDRQGHDREKSQESEPEAHAEVLTAQLSSAEDSSSEELSSDTDTDTDDERAHRAHPSKGYPKLN